MESESFLVRSRGQRAALCNVFDGREKGGAGYTNDSKAQGETVEGHTEIFQHQGRNRVTLNPVRMAEQWPWCTEELIRVPEPFK